MTIIPQRQWWQGREVPVFLWIYLYLLSCDEWTLAEHEVPTKATLSLLSSARQGRENIMKCSWVKIGTGRDHSLIIIKGKTDSTSQNDRMVWVGRDLKDHLVPTPLPWTGTPSTRPGCPKPHPTWPWTLPGRGRPQLLWATCSSASPPSQ